VMTHQEVWFESLYAKILDLSQLDWSVTGFSTCHMLSLGSSGNTLWMQCSSVLGTRTDSPMSPTRCFSHLNQPRQLTTIGS
jgi:hypothetical protein